MNKNNGLEEMGVVKSPLNYTGGKAKLLSQIKSKFPKDFEVFYDVFSGGANVGVNIEAKEIYCVDKNKAVINLMQYIQQSSYEKLIRSIEQKIDDYKLSNSFKHGYDFYGCNSNNGLSKYNKTGFNELKQDYNKTKDNLLFLLLIIFSFNNEIRFNRSGYFNIPVGKRYFNANLRKKLQLFIEHLSKINISFLYKDFRDLNVAEIVAKKAFLYLDPPYILGNATYNMNNAWTEKDEMDLLDWIEQCHDNGLNFALSNVIEHKGKVHKLLLDWCLDNSFNIHELNYNYNNSNYQKNSQKETITKEVLITNY